MQLQRLCYCLVLPSALCQSQYTHVKDCHTPRNQRYAEWWTCPLVGRTAHWNVLVGPCTSVSAAAKPRDLIVSEIKKSRSLSQLIPAKQSPKHCMLFEVCHPDLTVNSAGKSEDDNRTCNIEAENASPVGNGVVLWHETNHKFSDQLKFEKYPEGYTCCAFQHHPIRVVILCLPIRHLLHWDFQQNFVHLKKASNEFSDDEKMRLTTRNQQQAHPSL